MLNRVHLIGRLGKDVELRYSGSGSAFGSFSIATDKRVKMQNGEYENKASWHNIVVFGKTAENCAEYIGKGSTVYVEGEIETRSYEHNGATKYITEIKCHIVKFLDRKDSQGGGQGGGNQQRSQKPSERYQQRQQPRNNQNNSGNEDLGPAFPSEASGIDDVPFN